VEAEDLGGGEGTEPQHHPDDQPHAHEREQAGQDRMLLSIGHVRFTPSADLMRRYRRCESIVRDEVNRDQSDSGAVRAVAHAG
jgi:hypothetical protein